MHRPHNQPLVAGWRATRQGASVAGERVAGHIVESIGGHGVAAPASEENSCTGFVNNVVHYSGVVAAAWRITLVVDVEKGVVKKKIGELYR